MMKTFLSILAITLSIAVKAQDVVDCVPGDTMVIRLGNYRGAVQWQESYDNDSWSLVQGETQDSIIRKNVQTSHWLRAKISEGTCEPLYTGTVHVKLASSIDCPVTVRDIDGNVYNTVEIGNQCWTKENLNTGKFADGSVIPLITDDAEWTGRTEAACCFFNNTSTFGDFYGRMYNQYVTADPRNVCPAGWHVPTDEEFAELISFLGGDSIAGGKLKATSIYWEPPNTGANNSSGFTAQPAGYRSSFDGSFSELGKGTAFWSQTAAGTDSAYGRGVVHNGANVFRGADNKKFGFSIRCLKN